MIGQLAQAVNIVDRNKRIVAAYKQHTPGSRRWCSPPRSSTRATSPKSSSHFGVNAEWASGETPRDERERIVREFRGDGIDVLVNCGLYLEGFDVPSVQVILNARPTKSTTLYTQITGRALRPLDEIAVPLSNTNSGLERRELIEKSAKPAAIVIDLVDQAQRHQLVTVPSLYGLPPHIDAQGRMTAQVADKFEELLRRDPKRAGEGAHRRRDRDRAGRDRRVRRTARDQADVPADRSRESLAHGDAAAADRVRPQGPADPGLRAPVGSVGRRSAARRAARRRRALREPHAQRQPEDRCAGNAAASTSSATATSS